MTDHTNPSGISWPVCWHNPAAVLARLQIAEGCYSSHAPSCRFTCPDPRCVLRDCAHCVGCGTCWSLPHDHECPTLPVPRPGARAFTAADKAPGIGPCWNCGAVAHTRDPRTDGLCGGCRDAVLTHGVNPA